MFIIIFLSNPDYFSFAGVSTVWKKRFFLWWWCGKKVGAWVFSRQSDKNTISHFFQYYFPAPPYCAPPPPKNFYVPQPLQSYPVYPMQLTIKMHMTVLYNWGAESITVLCRILGRFFILLKTASILACDLPFIHRTLPR